ncbi:MAG: hypothetical protein M3Y86_09780 [Verrucomicrobiota bacterium]|nr:hypothetical protein [Verrucomicrobiota bacterium]
MAVAVVVVLVLDSVLMLVSGVEVAIGVAVEVVPMVVLVLLDVLVPMAADGDGFTIVVLFSVFSGAGDPAGVTVSLFCSQAVRSAALARMQMYFFIV